MRHQVKSAFILAIVIIVANFTTGFAAENQCDGLTINYQTNIFRGRSVEGEISLQNILSDEDYAIYKQLKRQIDLLEGNGQYEDAAVLWEMINKILEENLASYEALMESGEDIEYASVYDIVEGEIRLSLNPEDYPYGEVLKPNPKSASRHQDVFELFKKIVPDEYMGLVKKFTSVSDGIGGIGALVSALDDTGDAWIFIYDPEDFYDSYGDLDTGMATVMMVHELGHLITLGNGQIDSTETEETYMVSEGKMAKDSYLNQFYNRFWKGYELVYKNPNDLWGESYNAYALYRDYPDRFVSPYAAFNPVEDIAETFVVYILKSEKGRSKMQLDKIRFFDQYPEMQALKTTIRSRINRVP